MHASLAEQHRWYASVLRGHYGHYGMPATTIGHSAGSRKRYRASSSLASGGEAGRARYMGGDVFAALTERFLCIPGWRGRL
jgi:RNA-directed DNA polymerase